MILASIVVERQKREHAYNITIHHRGDCLDCKCIICGAAHPENTKTETWRSMSGMCPQGHMQKAIQKIGLPLAYFRSYFRGGLFIIRLKA